MEEVLVYKSIRTEIIDSPIPTADAGKKVIKVEVSGTNPKNWKTWWIPELPINMDDDIAETIREVGQGVTGFKVLTAEGGTMSQRGKQIRLVIEYLPYTRSKHPTEAMQSMLLHWHSPPPTYLHLSALKVRSYMPAPTPNSDCPIAVLILVP